MQSAELELNITYGQIAVFASSLEQPFNDWTERHVSQGFAWRPGSVSFRTQLEAGSHIVKVHIVDHLSAIDVDSARTIEVPFEVPPDGNIEVASISESVPLVIPPSLYLLRCEFMTERQGSDHRIHLIFAGKDIPRFAVIDWNGIRTEEDDLLITAKPAGS
jgi:hypothetical protein